jgi:hypothetical protein
MVKWSKNSSKDPWETTVYRIEFSYCTKFYPEHKYQETQKNKLLALLQEANLLKE